MMSKLPCTKSHACMALPSCPTAQPADRAEIMLKSRSADIAVQLPPPLSKPRKAPTRSAVASISRVTKRGSDHSRPNHSGISSIFVLTCSQLVPTNKGSTSFCLQPLRPPVTFTLFLESIVSL